MIKTWLIIASAPICGTDIYYCAYSKEDPLSYDDFPFDEKFFTSPESSNTTGLTDSEKVKVLKSISSYTESGFNSLREKRVRQRFLFKRPFPISKLLPDVSKKAQTILSSCICCYSSSSPSSEDGITTVTGADGV